MNEAERDYLMKISYQNALRKRAKDHDRALVTLDINPKHMGKHRFFVQFSLPYDQALQLSNHAVRLIMKGGYKGEKGIGTISDERTLEEKLEQAKGLLRASLERFENTERTPASDRLAFEIEAYLNPD